MNILIIIPTFNEAENLPKLVERIQETSLPFRPHLLIVDDASPDGTGKLAEDLASQRPELSVLHRERKEGLARAYIAGFNWGLDRHFDWLLQMDADFSHDPSYLPAIVQHILSEKVDVVVGSRYTAGGGVENWSLFRRWVSRTGNFYASWWMGYPLSDWTGGFNAWRATVLQRLNLEGIHMNGYGFQIELKYRAYQEGFRFLESPIVFTDRKRGRSKMSKLTILEAFWRVPMLRLSPRSGA